MSIRARKYNVELHEYEDILLPVNAERMKMIWKRWCHVQNVTMTKRTDF